MNPDSEIEYSCSSRISYVVRYRTGTGTGTGTWKKFDRLNCPLFFLNSSTALKIESCSQGSDPRGCLFSCVPDLKDFLYPDTTFQVN